MGRPKNTEEQTASQKVAQNAVMREKAKVRRDALACLADAQKEQQEAATEEQTASQKVAQNAVMREKAQVRRDALACLADAQKEQHEAAKNAEQQEKDRVRMQTARGLQTDAEKNHVRETNKTSMRNTRYESISCSFI